MMGRVGLRQLRPRQKCRGLQPQIRRTLFTQEANGAYAPVLDCNWEDRGWLRPSNALRRAA